MTGDQRQVTMFSFHISRFESVNTVNTNVEDLTFLISSFQQLYYLFYQNLNHQ